MRFFRRSIWLVFLAMWLPGLAGASGLGKFAQGMSSEKRECRSEGQPPSGALYKLRASAMLGKTFFPADDNSLLSLYLDGGYRFLSDTTGCSSSSGFFSSKSWFWYSMSIGVDAELTLDDLGASAFGPMLAWDARQASKGWLADVFNRIPFGFGATAGLFLRGDQVGVGGSVNLRAIADFKFAGKYEFDNVWSWSFHIGFIDPHISLYQLFAD